MYISIYDFTSTQCSQFVGINYFSLQHTITLYQILQKKTKHFHYCIGQLFLHLDLGGSYCIAIYFADIMYILALSLALSPGLPKV